MNEPTTDAPSVPKAPYGFKADGTPRKRPAPSAAQLAAAAAGRARSKARSNALSTAPESPRPGRLTSSPIIGRMVAELDEEIARLTAARDGLRRVA